jgi:hypothetical protein
MKLGRKVPARQTCPSDTETLEHHTCVLCWSNAPTMFSDHTEETRRYVSGACTWHRGEANHRTIGPSSLSLASSQSCFIASGSRKNRIYRSMQ